MWVWLLMLTGVIGVRFLIPDALDEKKKNLIFLALAFGIVVFVSGSRCPYLSGSQDLYDYFLCYKSAITMPLSQMMEEYQFEVGYLVLNKVLAWLVPWEYFIIYFESAFCTGVMFWYIYRNSDNVFLSVVFYICIGVWSFFLTGFRQGFAVCICIIAYELIKKDNALWDLLALILILLASSFHNSALVFLAVFFIRRIKIKKETVTACLCLTIFALIFAQSILDFINKQFETNYEGIYIGNVFGGLVPILVYVLGLLLCYFAWKDDPKEIESLNFDVSMLFVGLCVYLLRYRVGIFERISYYFTPVAVVVITNGITRQNNSVRRNIIMVLALVLSITLYLYRRVIQDAGYHFYWEYLENLIVF